MSEWAAMLWPWVFGLWCLVGLALAITLAVVTNHFDKRLKRMQKFIDGVADDLVDTWLSLSHQQRDDIVTRKRRRL